MHLNKTFHALVLAGIASLALPAHAQEKALQTPAPATTIATVNGVAISSLAVEVLREQVAASRSIAPEAANDEAMRGTLITAEILAQEAAAKGLDKGEKERLVLELQRKDTLARLLLDNYMETHPVSDERVKVEYDKEKARAGETEYQARHILVDDEKLAKEIAGKINDANFAELAKKHSKDSSAQKGGELGWMAPANLVPDFAEAMVKLKKGEITKTPVKSRFGWHIIKLEDTRKLEFPALDKVKNRIHNQLMQQDIRKYVGDLRATAKVDIPAAKAETAAPKAAAPAAPTAKPAAPAAK